MMVDDVRRSERQNSKTKKICISLASYFDAAQR